jgi:hypothetical protein
MKKVTAEENLKTFSFYFQMPELTSVNMGQSATAKAGDIGTAFNRAWKEVKKRKGVRCHSITQMKVSIVEAERPKPVKPSKPDGFDGPGILNHLVED